MKRNKLIKLRKEKKKTQACIANEVGIDRGYYSNIENGKKMGSLDTWLKIAKVLEIPPVELLSYIIEGMEISA